jgi:hypothetical protein
LGRLPDFAVVSVHPPREWESCRVWSNMASPYLDLAIGAVGLTNMCTKYGTGKDMTTTDGSTLDNGMVTDGLDRREEESDGYRSSDGSVGRQLGAAIWRKRPRTCPSWLEGEIYVASLTTTASSGAAKLNPKLLTDSRLESGFVRKRLGRRVDGRAQEPQARSRQRRKTKSQERPTGSGESGVSDDIQWSSLYSQSRDGVFKRWGQRLEQGSTAI